MKIAFLILGLWTAFSSPSQAQLGLSQSEFEQKFGQIDRGKYRARGFALEVEFTDDVATKIIVGKNSEIALSEAERSALVKSLSKEGDQVEFTPTKVIMISGDLVRMKNANAAVNGASRRLTFTVTQVLADGLLCMDANDFTTFFLRGSFDAAEGDKRVAVVYPAGKVEYTSVIGVQKTVRAYHTDRELALRQALGQ